MFFKSQKKEYFTNCITLGIDYKSDFDLDAVFDAQDVLLGKEDANEMAINLSASFFLKNMKKIQKWKKSKSFKEDCASFEFERKAIEKYENSDYTSDSPNDFLNSANDENPDETDLNDKTAADATEESKTKFTGKRHDFLDGDD